MKQMDTKEVPVKRGEIRLFSVMKNEAFRLPYWLHHYRRIGVDRFFIVDNASSDETGRLLLDQPDVHLYRSDEDFQRSQSGRLWLSSLMATHGNGYWCVVADADEVLAYPDWETVPLRTLTETLEAEGHDTLECLLLDMYSDLPIRETHYAAGSDPFAICPWFDPDFKAIEGAVDHNGGRILIPTYVGSTRRKAFGVEAYLSKIGLVRYRPEMLLTRGQHGIVGGRPSPLRGVLFHFKYFADFPDAVSRVMLRGERANCSAEWRAYQRALERNPRLSLHDHRSVRLIDSHQLCRLGLMRTSDTFERHVRGAVR